MHYSVTVEENCIQQIPNDEPETLEFEGAITVNEMVGFYSPEGTLLNCYVVKLRGHRTITSRYFSTDFANKMPKFLATAPSLSQFGKDLVVGETYVISGSASEDTDGHFVWEFNPLLAQSRIPVICPYLLNRVIVTGRGRITNVIEYTDDDPNMTVKHEIIVSVRFLGSHIGTKVHVCARPNNVPNEIIGTYLPGSYVYFRGYLSASRENDEQGADDKMVVEVLSHEELRRG